MSGEFYRAFPCFGSEIRLYVGRPVAAGALPAEVAGTGIEALMRMMDARLSRFRPDSELCQLNASEASTVPASPLLRLCTRAAIAAGELSDGLVDSTLVGELEDAGYKESRANATPAPLASALAAAPPRQPAHASEAAGWRSFSVDDAAGTISRPPGVRLDSGGVGKGLAADLGSDRLSGYERVLVDAGGDLRVRSASPDAEPYEVGVEHPLSGEIVHSFMLRDAAIATSGLATRVWQTADGFAHHLIDPGRGTPAWTGVIQATAVADTALAAETLAKTALLAGARRAAEVLAPRGGALVLDDGSVELFEGPLDIQTPRQRVSA